MHIRRFTAADLDMVLQLFYDTVHYVNSKDYTQEQVNAWAPQKPDKQRWLDSLLQHSTYVAELDNQIVGFADITDKGYLDRLYTHKDFQGRGIATALLKKVEQQAKEQGSRVITTEASITAKSFFEHHGYYCIQAQNKVHRSGVIFLNYLMSKHL